MRLLTNSNGIIGLLPILASLFYSIWTYKFKTAQSIRFGLIINILMWNIHDVYMKLYTSVIWGFVIILFTIITCIRCKEMNADV